MRVQRVLGVTGLIVLSACQSECSCGSSVDDGDGGGGSTTSSSVASTTTSGSGAGGQGSGGEGATSQGGGGSGGDGGVGGSGGAGGGTGGTGGQGGAGSGGGPVASPECQLDADCQLVSDCCVCDAIPTSERPDACAKDCLIDSCTSLGLPAKTTPSCVAGQCVAGFDCDWAQTTCDAAPPDCPEGMTASVVDGCYGACVPATECVSVGGCDQCDGGLACVLKEALPVQVHCVDPAPCSTNDCACLGPAVCAPSSEVCSEDAGGVTCSCLDC